jgi:starvation-inducible DNA-binding protein
MNTAVIENLFKLLASSYVYQAKLQRAHWNVSGALFYQLHLLFERIYGEVNGTLDRIAEDTRSLDVKLPVSLANFAAVSVIPEFTEEQDPMSYVAALLSDAKAIMSLMEELQAAINYADQGDMSEGMEEDMAMEPCCYLGIANLVGDLTELYGSFVYLLRSALG